MFVIVVGYVVIGILSFCANIISKKSKHIIVKQLGIGIYAATIAAIACFSAVAIKSGVWINAIGYIVMFFILYNQNEDRFWE